MEDWEEIQALLAQGHERVENPEHADIILHPKAHRMSESERPWLSDAIAEARRLKYPPKEKA